MNCLNTWLVAALILVLTGCGAEERSQFAEHSSANPTPGSAKNAAEAPAESAPSERQIIYVSTVDLVVESFSEMEAELVRLVSESGGYIATFREERRYGGQ